MLEKIKANLKDLPSTLLGIALLLGALPQDEAIQKVMALSPRIANILTTTACIAGGVASILLIGQRMFGQKK